MQMRRLIDATGRGLETTVPGLATGLNIGRARPCDGERGASHPVRKIRAQVGADVNGRAATEEGGGDCERARHGGGPGEEGEG